MLKKMYKTLVLILLLQATSFAQTISISEQINNDSLGFMLLRLKREKF